MDVKDINIRVYINTQEYQDQLEKVNAAARILQKEVHILNQIELKATIC